MRATPVRRLNRRRLLRLGIAASSAAALAACTPSSPAGGTPAAVSGAAQPSAARLRTLTGELRAAVPQRFPDLDFHGSQALSAAPAARQFADSLVIVDAASGALAPGLATSWQTPDELTWVFTLRPGVKFHDGSPLRAADVKASVERVAAQKAVLGPLWADVESVSAPDDLTVRIRTKKPLGTLARNAATLFVGPAGKMDSGAFWAKPVGSGPFTVRSWKADAELALDGNADYWGGAPGLKSLVFRQIPEEIARVTALETGEIGFTRGVSPDQLTPLRRNAELKTDSAPSFIYQFAWMNAKRKPFTDRRVRQAMWHALDVDTIIKDLLGGVATRSRAPIPSTVFGFAPQTAYAFDPGKAKQLLAEAGYPNGFETAALWAENQAGPQGRQVVQAMLSYWAKIGVKVRSDEFEQAKWVENLVALNWDIVLVRNAVVTGDADYTLRRLYHSAANRTGYADPQLDRLLDDAAAAVDQKKRQDLYAQANKIIWDQAIGIFPFEYLETYVYRKNVQGLIVTPNEIPEFHRVTIG